MSYTLSKKAFDKLCKKDIVWNEKTNCYVNMDDLHLDENCYLEIIHHKPKDNDLHNVKTRIGMLHSRFKQKEDKQSEDYIKMKGKTPKHAFDNDFDEFVDWWATNCKKDEGPVCYYCGTSEKTYKKIFDKRVKDADAQFVNGKLHQSKKPSFNSEFMEIDKKDPSKGYIYDNCVFACHLCNNAKSDMISAEDFKKKIGPAIKAYTDYLK